MGPQGRPTRTEKPEATWELVLKRNSVERLKQEKSPLGMLDELPALIAAGYENVPEEDLVRLKWWGLYHDKPKVGTFMLRVKLPSGYLTPAKLRAIGEVANTFGRGDGELSTRQNIQLHWLELAALPEVLARLDAAGLTTAGGCGDTVRNITGCPVQGIDPNELFDCSDVVEEAARFFYGNPDFVDLPRKHKYTIAACADRCNAPEINCIAFVGVVHGGRPGFAVRVGGGLSSVPRLSRDMGVFVPKEEAVAVLAAITSAWSEDLRYRVSRVKARLKFMIDDIGPEGMRERVEAKLGRALEDFELAPVAIQPSDHVGVHEQKQPGRRYIGFPVHLGLVSGDQMIAIADLADEGRRRQAYDIFVRGGLGPDAAIGRPLFRRVLSEELEAAVEGLVQGWLDDRVEGESFAAFSRRLSDEELGELAGIEPARQREREEVAA